MVFHRPYIGMVSFVAANAPPPNSIGIISAAGSAIVKVKAAERLGVILHHRVEQRTCLTLIIL